MGNLKPKNQRMTNFAIFYILLFTSVQPNAMNNRDSQSKAVLTTAMKPDKTDFNSDIECSDGQIVDGKSCVDINECLEATSNNCQGSICNNIDGGFYCSCTDGNLVMSNDVTSDKMDGVYFECCNENDDSCNYYYDYSDEEECSKDWLELGRDFIISLYTQILDLFLTVDG